MLAVGGQWHLQVKSLIKTLKCLQSDDKYQALLFLISAIKLYVKFLYNDNQERIYKPSILKELSNIQNVIIANLLKCRSAAGTSSSSSAVACELRTSVRNNLAGASGSDGILLFRHGGSRPLRSLSAYDLKGKLLRGGLFDGIPLSGAVNIKPRNRLGTITCFGSVQLNRSLVRLIASRNFKLLFNMFEQNVFPTWKIFKENRPGGGGRSRTRPSMPAICYSGGSSHSPPAAYIKKEDFDFDAPYSLAVDDPCFEELKDDMDLDLLKDEDDDDDDDDSISNEIYSEESSTNNTLMLSSDTNTLDTNDSNLVPGERSKEQVYQCLLCDKSHHPGFCPDCGKQRGATSLEIIEHNKIHHKNRPHICEHCGETFSRNQQYQVHVQGHFINKMKMQEQNSKKTYKYSCRSCGIVFNNQKYLEKHVQKTGHQAEGVICETCGAVFSSNIKLHQHVARTHKNEKRFTCEHCSKVFNQKANLDRHLLLHTNISEKSYPCEQCSASYLSMASLREHIKVAHIGDEKFECNICHKLFAAKRSLKRHKLCHSEERPFPCTVENCKEAYKNQSHLVRHMKTAHHIETPPKRIQKVIKSISEQSTDFVPLDPIGTGDSSASKSNPINKKPVIGGSDKSIGDSSTNFSDNMSAFNYDYVDPVPAAAPVTAIVDQGQQRLQMLGPAGPRMGVHSSATAGFSDHSATTAMGYGGQSSSDHFEWQNLEFGGGNGPGTSQQPHHHHHHHQQHQHQQQHPPSMMTMEHMSQGYMDNAHSKGGFMAGAQAGGGGLPGMRVFPVSFSNNSDFESIESNSFAQDPNLICEHCDETNFLNSQQLQVHIQDHFSAKDGKEPTGKKLQRLHCKTCNLVFATGAQLDRHILKTNHHTDCVACDLCSAIFNSNLKVYQHMLKCHKNETWYACEQCSKVFILKHEYDKHQLVHQTVTDKSVICEHCASSFFSQEALKEHIKISHTVEKKYECNICNKLFAAKRSLKRHKLCHEEEGAFPCPVEDCKESFKTPTSLAKHKKMVHSIGPEPGEKGGAKGKAAAAAKAASEKLLPEPPPVAAALQSASMQPGTPTPTGLGMGPAAMAMKMEPRTPTGMLVPPSRTSSTSSAGAGSNPNTIPYGDPYGAAAGMHYNNVMGQQPQQQGHFAVQQNPALHYGAGVVPGAGRVAAGDQSMTYRMDPNAAGQYGHGTGGGSGAGYGHMNSSFEWRGMELPNSIDPGMGTSSGTGGQQSVQSVAATMKANKYYPEIWNSNMVKMEYQQQQQQQQQQDDGSSPNVAGSSYNNIGNILSNLELIGNNSTYEQTYDIVPPNAQHAATDQQQQQAAQVSQAHVQQQMAPKNNYHKQQPPPQAVHHQQQYFQEQHHPHAGGAATGLHHHVQMQHGHHSQQQTPSPHHHPPHMQQQQQQQFQGAQHQQQLQQQQQHQYNAHLPHHHATGPPGGGAAVHHTAAGPSSAGLPHQQQQPGMYPQQAQQQQQDHTLTDISKTNNLQFVDSFTESIDYLQQSFQYV
ncbi:hypothetical protein quinque_002655 [Culex quinquefasciatus]